MEFDVLLHSKLSANETLLHLLCVSFVTGTVTILTVSLAL